MKAQTQLGQGYEANGAKNIPKRLWESIHFGDRRNTNSVCKRQTDYYKTVIINGI